MRQPDIPWVSGETICSTSLGASRCETVKAVCTNGGNGDLPPRMKRRQGASPPGAERQPPAGSFGAGVFIIAPVIGMKYTPTSRLE